VPFFRRAICLLFLTLVGCSGATRPADSAVRKPERPALDATLALYLEPEPITPTRITLDDIRFVGMDDGPVPDFRLRAVSGQWFDSRQLVGERAFVVVFFATWCRVCDLKLPLLKRAVSSAGPVTVIGVSVDDRQTWPKVDPYVRRHGLREMPVVPALRYPMFAISYNPFSTVPLVVVVGKNGGLVDYQLGYEPNDERRLEAAVRLAKNIGPLKPAE